MKKIVNGKILDMTAEEIVQRDAEEAAWSAGKPERDKTAFNAPILAQIAAKELLTLRPMRELRRGQEFADIPATDVTAARARLKALDDEIRVLRGRLTP